MTVETQEDFNALMDRIKQNDPTLTSLNLMGVIQRLDDGRAREANLSALARALAKNHTLTSVDLSQNLLKDDFGPKLIRRLINILTLTHVQLEQTQLGKKSAVPLATLLKQKRLIDLNISFNMNNALDSQLLSILNAALESQQLQKFNMFGLSSQRAFSPEEAHVIGQLIPKLQELKLAPMKFLPDDFQAIEDICRANQTCRVQRAKDPASADITATPGTLADDSDDGFSDDEAIPVTKYYGYIEIATKPKSSFWGFVGASATSEPEPAPLTVDVVRTVFSPAKMVKCVSLNTAKEQTSTVACANAGVERAEKIQRALIEYTVTRKGEIDTVTWANCLIQASEQDIDSLVNCVDKAVQSYIKANNPTTEESGASSFSCSTGGICSTASSDTNEGSHGQTGEKRATDFVAMLRQKNHIHDVLTEIEKFFNNDGQGNWFPKSFKTHLFQALEEDYGKSNQDQTPVVASKENAIQLVNVQIPKRIMLINGFEQVLAKTPSSSATVEL